MSEAQYAVMAIGAMLTVLVGGAVFVGVKVGWREGGKFAPLVFAGIYLLAIAITALWMWIAGLVA